MISEILRQTIAQKKPYRNLTHNANGSPVIFSIEVVNNKNVGINKEK
jgi:hypothetical protein